MTPSHPSAPLRILVLTTGHIEHPVSGTERRTHHLCAELARLGHHVDVYAWVARNHRVKLTKPRGGMRVRLLHSAFFDMALTLDRLRLMPATELMSWMRGARRRVQHMARRRHYDIVQFELPWLTGLMDDLPETLPAVYDAHNIESAYWRNHLSRFPASQYWLNRLETAERRAGTHARLVLACSQPDADWFRSAGASCVEFLPNGYNPAESRPPDPELRRRLRRERGWDEDRHAALFIGTDTDHNRLAARALLERVVPSDPRPEALYVIAGRVGNALDHPGDPRVSIVGPVEQAAAWMQAADVGLNPLESGSGSNIKLVEYLATGLPVVSTEFGLRGFESLRDHVRVGELDRFAEIIAQATWPCEVPAAVIETFAWNKLAERLSEHYRALIDGPAAS